MIGGVVLALSLLLPLVSTADTFLDADFDSDDGGFVYLDDAFRSTASPAYASGAYLPSGGELGGGLSIALGNVDGADINGMSGGFSRDFCWPQSAIPSQSLFDSISPNRITTRPMNSAR